MTPSSVLRVFIDVILEKAQEEQDPLRFFFLFNQHFGFRWSELAPENVTPLGGNLFKFKAKKRGVDRIIQIPEEFEVIKLYYTGNLGLYSVSIFTAQRKIAKYIAPRKLLNNKKNLETHIFRHYIAKLMFENGQTVPAISAFLGEKTPNASEKYIFSDILII